MKWLIILGLLGIIVLAGCSYEVVDIKEENLDFWFEQSKACNRLLDGNLLESLNWECVEYANKTIVNPEWFDNCCFDINTKLQYGEDVEYDAIINDSVVVTLKLANYEEQTLYAGGKMCVESDKHYGKFVVEGQTIDSTKCSMTPKRLTTNESVCIMKRLNTW